MLDRDFTKKVYVELEEVEVDGEESKLGVSTEEK